MHLLAGSSRTAVPWEELSLLPELNPPNVMPRGNVGTPLSTFMQLIRSCKLPSQLIRKLQLEFPKSRAKKRYGAVALDYGTEVELGNDINSEVVESEPAVRGSHGSRMRGKGVRGRLSVHEDDEAGSDKEEEIPPVSLF